MNRIVSGQKVLVTGGAGFIGSNLVESMLDAGNHVVCLDNFSTGKRENIRGLMDNPDFRLIEGDIRNYQVCEKSVKGIDFVFHQAALGSVPRSASKEAKVRRFIYAASSSTYGDHTDLPKVEEKIGKPLSPYGITKYVDELFAANFAALYNIEVIGLRYFNVFGRRQDPQGAYAAVIPLFVEKLLRHEPPVINGDGSYSRDFTYIDNVLQANHLAALAKDQPAVNQVYNIAYGERTSLIELFELVRNLIAGFDSEVMGINPVYETVRAGDIPHSLASIGKAKRLLGYNPTHTVREGLAEAIQWYRTNL
jgi:UDP-N-acetylglucosamine 4-epimerase